MSKRSKALDARAQALFPVATEPNPMVRRHGAACPVATCRTCRHLLRTEGGMRIFYKCRLRVVSSSAATDHRCGWNACALFEVRV